MKILSFLFLLTVVFAACEDNTIDPSTIDAGTDPNFKIVANQTGELTKFNRYVDIFGIKIFAVERVDDANLLHAANLMAQYLDNDEDSIPDNPVVLAKMVEDKAFMVMWNSQRDLNINPPNGWTGQDLGNDETQPNFVASGKTGQFDAALEEVLHIITHAGYAQVYPDIFGEKVGSSIADAMDVARGGQFQSIPSSYPNTAWYTYDDNTCDYGCMVTEYHYWALTSILGAQDNRLNEIDNEWKLNTMSKVQDQDNLVYQLLTDPQYKFPAVLPDGTYRR